MNTCTTIVQSLSLLTLLCLEIKQMQNLIYYYCFITMNTHWPYNNKIPRYRQLPSSISGSSENCIKTKISIHIISVFRFDMT